MVVSAVEGTPALIVVGVNIGDDLIPRDPSSRLLPE
jgi:hypothetical protein